VGEGIAHPAQAVERLFHGPMDQAKPGGQGDPGPEGAEGPIGLEEGLTAAGRCQGCSEQGLQGGIDPGDAY
jgi:hypothetical protein